MMQHAAAAGASEFRRAAPLGVSQAPLESCGELIYEAPDQLEKRTLEARPESLVLDGDVLTVRRGQRRCVVGLKFYAQIPRSKRGLLTSYSRSRRAASFAVI